MSVSQANPEAQERRHGANLGAISIVSCAFVVLCTVWFLPSREAGRSTSAAMAAGGALVAVCLTRLPWDRWPTRALIAFPALGLCVLTADALLTTGITPAYGGFFTVGFVYLGLTQSRLTTLAMIPLAVPAWILCVGGLTSTVEVKTPVSVAIWALLGFNLATGAARSATRTDELMLAASTDSLTGLLSRGELEGLLKHLSPGDAVILLDLDGFKEVNDAQGHGAGDLVLAAFGHRVRSALRAGDQALRYGGDEVLVALRGAGNDGAEAMLNRLRGRWSSFPYPTFSAGVAVHEGGSTQVTMDRADQALYVAKRAGRDRWHLHGEQRGQELLELLRGSRLPPQADRRDLPSRLRLPGTRS